MRFLPLLQCAGKIGSFESMKVSHPFPAWRVALFVLVVAAITWLGAANIRAIISLVLLKPGTLQFDTLFAPEAEREVFRLISFTSVIIIASYMLTMISSIVFLATTPLKLKEEGWLTMSAILLYLFVPVELFTMYLDGRMIYLEFFTTAENEVFRELLLARIGALAGAPFIAQLCYYTIVALAIFQPLKKARPATA
jgi:hypothetical protein